MLVKNEYGFTKIIDALAIRNTGEAVSTAVLIEGYIEKGFYISNSLDQNLSVQIQGCFVNSSNDSDWVNIGSAQTVNSGTNAIIGVNEVAELNNYFPAIRVKVSCGVAPTSGSVTAYLMYA